MKRLKPTSILTASTLLMLLTIAALLSGCGSGGQKTTSPEAVRIITEASQKKDYIRVVLLADSLENAHVMSEGESYYWQGHAYYRLLQRRAAEFYWKESMKATENQTDTASLGTYAKSASYLTSLYIRYLDFPNALKVVKPGLDYVGESIDDFSNRLLLLYTDGLNEAENTVQEQFGDEQIVKLLSAMSSSKAQDIIENLKSEVERFRNGAEPNDDLTMMCVRYSSIQPV